MGPEPKTTGRPLPGIVLALGAADAAASLGVSTRSFRRFVKAGALPAGFHLGGRRLWAVSVLEAFVARASREAAAKAGDT